MGKEHDMFLQTFKKIEAAVREKGIDSVKTYEDSLPESEATKLRMCRNIRNYIAHEQDYAKFISISEDMQSFLYSILINLDSSETPVKKKMTPIQKGFIDKDTSILQIIDEMIKKKVSYILTFTKTGELSGIFTANRICELLSKGANKGTKVDNKSLDQLYNIIKPKKDLYNIVDSKATYKSIIDNDITIIIEDKKIIGYVCK